MSSGLLEPFDASETDRRLVFWFVGFPAFYAVASLPIVISVLIAANGKVLPHLFVHFRRFETSELALTRRPPVSFSSNRYYIVADCLFSALGIADGDPISLESDPFRVEPSLTRLFVLSKFSSSSRRDDISSSADQPPQQHPQEVQES